MDWNNLNLKTKTSLELREIRDSSYHRYDPPHLHSFWLFMGMLLIALAIMFYFMPVIIGNEISEGKVFSFWTIIIIMFVGGCVCLFIYFRKAPIAERRWDEMEDIRNAIDEEFQRRDILLGLVKE